MKMINKMKSSCISQAVFQQLYTACELRLYQAHIWWNTPAHVVNITSITAANVKGEVIGVISLHVGLG